MWARECGGHDPGPYHGVLQLPPLRAARLSLSGVCQDPGQDQTGGEVSRLAACLLACLGVLSVGLLLLARVDDREMLGVSLVSVLNAHPTTAVLLRRYIFQNLRMTENITWIVNRVTDLLLV